MAEFNVVKLHFTSPLHIGDRKNNDYGISLKTIASDTMYAALTSCLAKAGQTIPDDGDLGFAISSLFPYYQSTAESTPVYFLPMPLRPLAPSGNVDSATLKKIKKVQWVDTALYSSVLNLNGKDDIINGEYLTQQTIESKFVDSHVIQRVVLKSRVGEEDAEPFYVDHVTFKDQSGLYFIVTGDTQLLDKALAILSAEGIGTDRNVGNGFFEYEIGKISIDLPTQADYAMSISMFVPESQEQLNDLMNSEHIAYNFERRGGWITTYPHNSLRKNVIYAFTPGSVFCNINATAPIGRIVDLKPSAMQNGHPIWRCGKAIFLPLNL